MKEKVEENENLKAQIQKSYDLSVELQEWKKKSEEQEKIIEDLKNQLEKAQTSLKEPSFTSPSTNKAFSAKRLSNYQDQKKKYERTPKNILKVSTASL